MNWKNFGLTLLHAAIGGAATGAASIYGSGNASLKTLGLVAASSAITSVISLFAQPPAAPAPKQLN